MAGPAWLGIGAQRSGTTWFCDLLLQHPQVRLAAKGRKELHMLYRGLRERVDLDEYLGQFNDDGVGGAAGEFTPYYLRALWVPPVALQVVQPGAPIRLLLRDPVERFASSMRLEATRESFDEPGVADRMLGSDAQWAGMYATQLEAWERLFGPDRLVVMQYERVRRSPQSFVDDVWDRLGLPSVELHGVEAPSTTTVTDVKWEWPPGLHGALRRCYMPEVERLERWGIDASLWPNFADAAVGQSGGA